MFDINFIRENPAAFDDAMARRGQDAIANKILEMDSQRRSVLTQLQEVQSLRNEKSKEIGKIKSSGGDAAEIMAEVSGLKDKMQKLEDEARVAETRLNDQLAVLPNMPADDVPDGDDEDDNLEVRTWGTPADIPNAKDHEELGAGLGMIDFERAAKLSGSRFIVLRSDIARLERALGDFMLETHTKEFDYEEVSPPLLVHDPALFGTSQLPKFAEDLFRTHTGHYLIPTAEVPLTNLVADTIIDAADLPLRFTARTPCFRSEAGSAGKDTKGMLRQHQFYKVEMVSITAPDKSAEEHERMTQCAETILKRLELPFRTVSLCTGDLGFGAIKTYDLEVWLPGQGRYREISSCSNCADFQARRMKARYREAGEKKTNFVHTLNGSGLAIGRCLIAVMENYQQPDGTIIVPSALRPFMDGQVQIPAEHAEGDLKNCAS